MKSEEVVADWVRVVGEALESHSLNAAMCLLRDVIGGSDIHKVSMNLTVEMEERWMDDTTILIRHVGVRSAY